MIENTERLIQEFEEAYRRKATPPPPTQPPVVSTPPPPMPPPVVSEPAAPVRIITPAMRVAAEAQAKEAVRSKYGVNPELPGWRGLVLDEMRRILDESAD